MNATEWSRISAAFDELCDLGNEERDARLAEIERDDPGLAAELGAMLAADAVEAGALAAGPLALSSEVDAAEASEDATGGLAAGLRLGPWRLAERLGAGGMGEVWAAERADGTFEQRVAVKLLKRGLETERLVERFLLERRILGRLEHPGIARLLDAGSTPDGRPYFVLERVDGMPITRFAAERGLGVEARLELVRAACEAVDFAHRNLVVHRDLKPSNVLVDAGGAVKLLDFGIAKLIEGDSDGQRTELEGRALTPAYAAPEQIRGDAVTTATDVYSLGVLLYELLTGRLPHRRSTRSWPELASELERETVERPSAAARRGEAGSAPAGMSPDRLVRRLAGDLDTIVLKALAAEPERRYPTAAALAEDLRRHLARLPISARPDALGYRVGRFVGRNRLAVIAAAAVVVALVAGLAAALWQADRATRAARRAERVRDFLVSIFESRDPDLGAGRGQTVEQLVDDSAARLASELAGEPEVEADLSDALARAESSLGRFENAERLARRALDLRSASFGERSPETAASLTTLGAIAQARGDAGAAEELLRRAIALAADGTAAEGVETSRARIELSAALTDQGRYPEALEQAERGHGALLAALGPDHRATLNALSRHARAAIDGGDRLAAERLLREALSGDPARTATSPVSRAVLRRQLADALMFLRHNEEARREIDRALEELERLLGGDHLEVVMALHVRSMVRGQAGDFEGASQDALRGLAILERIDPDHPMRGTLFSAEATSLLHLGQLDRALALNREDLARMERKYGPDSTRALDARSVVAGTLFVAGRYEEALVLLEGIVERLRADPKLGRTLLPGSVYGVQQQILLRLGRVAEAVAASRSEVELLRARGIAVDPVLRTEAEMSLAVALVAAGTPAELAEARQLVERAQAAAEAGFHSRHAEVPGRLLARIDAVEGHLDSARRRLEEALATAEAAGHATSAEAGEMRLELGLVLERLNDLEGARRELLVAESLLFRRRGRDAPETLKAREALARIAARSS